MVTISRPQDVQLVRPARRREQTSWKRCKIVCHAMKQDGGVSFFDTPRRSSRRAIVKTAREIAATPLVRQMLEAFPGAAVLLDANRQIVASNERARALFGGVQPAEIRGLRLGEAIECEYARTTPAGCGTSPACAQCGAGGAICEAGLSQLRASRECRVTALNKGRRVWMDLRVQVTPVELAGHRLRLVALEDIAHEKRRDILERIFFHDVLGTANAVHGLARMLCEAAPEKAVELASALVRSSRQMLEEIQAQRDLMRAEHGDLEIVAENVAVNSVLESVRQQYNWSPLAEGREIVCPVSPGSLRTDRVQLVRSLGNLVRNALEAIAAGERVTLSAERANPGVLFKVANPGEIPARLQTQIFQRSFSTKSARGRGVGTYSVKLIVEQYLNGKVSFTSSAQAGTVFSIWLPARLELRGNAGRGPSE
jgi:signal transduction histidine kinase